jgi:hypothetical protein
MAQQPESIAKRSATQRHHRRAIQNWNRGKLPAWLTRDVYLKQIQPARATVPKSHIRSVLGVSERIPHPRHWQALARLVGIDSRPLEEPPKPLAFIYANLHSHRRSVEGMRAGKCMPRLLPARKRS